ncbi:MAG: redox-sensing transcriptional repressor Rex [Phycisphaeraceae bacterium]|nr:redox-sensing transcriptional repressor Rex [Phycisphaeraceae bacterium]
MSERVRIPKPTARRLSLYLRELSESIHAGRVRISSKVLGDALGLTDAQVRKDLACFGQFGQPGVGYRAADLSERIRRIMGRDHRWNLALVGAGNIGRAILAYRSFRDEGFQFAAVFDQSPQLVGQTIAGLRVLPVASLAQEVRARQIQIGVIATPAEAAQEVADRLVAAGVDGILNFAPRRLTAPSRVCMATVDLTVAIEQLAFDISIARGREGVES